MPNGIISDTLARKLMFDEHEERWTPPCPHPKGKVMRPRPNRGLLLVSCGFEDRATGESRSSFDLGGFDNE